MTDNYPVGEHDMRAEITRLRSALTAREQATVGGVPVSDSVALSLCMSECKRLQDSVAIREADALERVAQLLAHRACCSEEHDPVHGKIHGYCVVCGLPWPCSIAKSKTDTARDEAIRVGIAAASEAIGLLVSMVACGESHSDTSRRVVREAWDALSALAAAKESR